MGTVWICSVCQRVLNTKLTPYGVTHVHTTDDAHAGHDPIPIPIDPSADMRGRCDFCHADDPTHVLPVDDFTVPGLNHTSAGDWAACLECTALISRDAWDALTARSLREWEHRRGLPPGDYVSRTMRALHALVREHQRGPIEPMDPNERSE